MRKQARSLPDTNVLIRYLTADDESLHREAKEFFDRVREGSLQAVILESVIAECTYVLTKIYKVPRSRVAESLIDILRYRGIANSDRSDLIQSLTLFSQGNIDIVDCILCVKASGRGSVLFFFDKTLNKVSEASRRKNLDS